MNNKSNKSLGDFLHQLSKPEMNPNLEKEKHRIIGLLKDKNERTARKIFLDYCFNSKEGRVHFDKVTRKLVSGFRQRTSKFREQALPQVIKNMENHLDPLWDYLYANAVIHWTKNNGKFGILLAKTSAPENLDQASAIELLVEHRDKYDVSVDEINFLYKVWFFERDRKIEDNLANLRGVEIRDRSLTEVSRLSKQSSKLKADLLLGDSFDNKLEELERDIRNKFSSLNRISKDVIQINTARESELSQINGVQLKLKDIEQKIESTTSHYDELIKSRIDKTELTAITSKLENLNDRTLNQQKYVSEKLSDTEVLIESVMDDIENLKSTTLDRSIELKNNSELHQHQNTIAVIDRTNKSDKIKFDESEGAFIERLRNVSTLKNEDLNIVLANHYTAKHAEIFQDTTSHFIDSWLTTLGWESKTIEGFVDPNWTSFASWSSLAERFLVDDKLAVLILHDFHLGYQDGYLAPFLALFRRLMIKHKKVILIGNSEPSIDGWILQLNSLSVPPDVRVVAHILIHKGRRRNTHAEI